MNKKKLIIIIIIVALIAIVTTMLILHFNKRAKYVYDIEKVTDVKYNTICIDNRYGVIDENGNILIDPSYDLIQIPNPSKPVFICMSNYNTEINEYETKVLNDKKEQVITGYQNVQAIPTETTADGIPFEKTVLKYKKDGKYGLMNLEGNEITEPIYDNISAVTYKEGMFLVEQDSKLGVINLNGVVVVDVEYDNITVDNYYNVDTKYQKTGFIVSKIGDNGYRYGYINYKGDTLLETEYTEVSRITDIDDDNNIYLIAYKDGQAGVIKNKKQILDHEYEGIIYNATNDVFTIQRNGKYGVTDRNGKIKIEPQYSKLIWGGVYINVEQDGQNKVLDVNGNEVTDGYVSRTPTSDGNYSIVYGEDDIYKIIDNNGNVIIDKDYTYIEELDNNYYIVASSQKNGIIDLTGKSVIDLKYSSIFQLDDTELLQANIAETNTVSLINKDMQVIVTMDQAGVNVEDNYIKIYSEDDIKYFDYSGNELSAQELFPENNIYAKKINGKWGFVDKNGNVVVQNQYDMVTEINEYGFAGIRLGGKWGVINSVGEIIQDPVYEIDSLVPEFIGKYYKSNEWYGNDYYTDKVFDDTEDITNQTNEALGEDLGEEVIGEVSE